MSNAWFSDGMELHRWMREKAIGLKCVVTREQQAKRPRMETHLMARAVPSCDGAYRAVMSDPRQGDERLPAYVRGCTRRWKQGN